MAAEAAEEMGGGGQQSAAAAAGASASSRERYNVTMLKVGEAAPEFSTTATNGQPVSLAGLRGTWVVLYFFPKAFTAG